LKIRPYVVLLLSCLLLARHVPMTAAGGSSPTIVFTAAPKYLPLAWMQAADRFPQGAAVYIKDAKGTRKLFPDFASTADPSVSFDSAHILFAGKKTEKDPWQIWQADFDDLIPRQVLRSTQDSIRPLYLPEDRFIYAIRRGTKFTIENASLDGGDSKRISFASDNVLPSDILRDGRVLLTSSHANSSGSSAEVFALYTDGSGFESIRCDHAPTRFAAKELASGDIVFSRGARLALFTSPLATELAALLPPADYAGDIAETSNHDWLVSVRPQAKAFYALQVWHPKTKTFTPLISMPSQDILQPLFVAPRSVPNRHPSALHDWKFANLLALNVYTSKHAFAPGSITRVRVYTQDATGSRRLLGESPVEKDGSFFVRVDGDQPLQFEVTDASGKVLDREHGWFWARAGEQRVCVGCHAGPERAPENAVPEVLNRSTEPVDLTGPASQVGGH
jgi:Hydrazine synthase alpha subunit middle domain